MIIVVSEYYYRKNRFPHSKAKDLVAVLNTGSAFSVEIDSKKHVKKISVSDDAHDRVLFEGFLGAVKEVSIIESSALEIVGEYGALRVDLDADVLQSVLKAHDHILRLSSEAEPTDNASEMKIDGKK